MELDWGILVRQLKGEATDEDLKKLDIWLLDHDNLVQYKKIAEIWEKSGELQMQYRANPNKSWAVIEQRMNSVEKAKIMSLPVFNWWIRIAAAIIFMTVIVLVVARLNRPVDGSGQMVAFVTNDEMDSLLLSDGTLVWINKHSRLEYPEAFPTMERRVRLYGEAFFQVSKDETKPFMIESGPSLTQVLGTSFNILTDHNNTLIAVYSGKVAFSNSLNQEVLLLAKGESGELTEGRLVKSTIRDPNLIAWKTGLLVFDNTPLNEVVQTLSNYYEQHIDIDQYLGQVKLTTTFERQELEEALAVIAITLDLKVSKTKDGFLLNN
jgi:transmembrane sensor